MLRFRFFQTIMHVWECLSPNVQYAFDGISLCSSCKGKLIVQHGRNIATNTCYIFTWKFKVLLFDASIADATTERGQNIV
jgi:hypothetical protein